MKFFAIAALFAAVEASAGTPPAVGLGHAYIPATKTAVSLSPTTGRVPNSALNPGSAEAPDFAREADGALDMTDARAPHSQTRPQDSPRIPEQAVGRATQHPVNRYS